MATVYPGTDAYVAHMRGVKKSVREDRDRRAKKARAALRPHRRTGDHRIVVEMQDTDGLVHLVGTVPHIVEFGRSGYVTDSGAEVGPMAGLHILGQALQG